MNSKEGVSAFLRQLLICFLLMIGGSFAIFQETGAVEFGIRKLTDTITRRPRLEVLLVPTLDGDAIEDFGIRVAEAWRSLWSLSLALACWPRSGKSNRLHTSWLPWLESPLPRWA